MAYCPRASSFVRHTEGRAYAKTTPDGFGAVRTLRRVADDGSRWRCPGENHGFDAVVQNGSAASELCCRCASLHHGLGLWPAAYKDVARSLVHPAAAPLGRRHPDHRKCAVVLGAIKDKPFGWRYAPSLTAPARAGVSIEWVGTKKRA